MTREALGLLAAGVALITAFVSLTTALVTQKGLAIQQSQVTAQGNALDQQEKKLAQQAAQLEQLRTLAARTALDITIQRPRAGEALPPVYDNMGGRFSGSIPIGYKLWVLGHDRHNYFLMHPPIQVVSTEQRWSQSNVHLATPGGWELLVCIGSDVASKWLQGRADARDWSGFSALPEGLEVLRTVAVTR